MREAHSYTHVYHMSAVANVAPAHCMPVVRQGNRMQQRPAVNGGVCPHLFGLCRSDTNAQASQFSARDTDSTSLPLQTNSRGMEIRGYDRKEGPAN